ncbi:dienelactone hydrolase family protein [Fulvivirga kasyanovii]
MKTWIKVILGFLLMHSAMAQDRNPFKKEYFVSGVDTLKYRVLWPGNFSKARQYPVVLFLHGAGERGYDNEKQLVHGSKLFLEERDNYPAIVIFPQCPENDYWANVEKKITDDGRIFLFQNGGSPNKSLALVSGLLDKFLNESYVDKRRVYVGGLSMGGMGTFELVSRRPDTFAAAFAICGGGHPESAKRYAGKVPFWVFHGADDDVVPPKHSEIMVEAIKKAGGDVKFTLYPDTNHNSWDKAFAEPELLSWLFSNKKQTTN